LRSVRPENLSYADVAERSGVAVRTVYRHFPEPKDLLRAVAKDTIALFAAGGLARNRAGASEQLAAFHRTLSDQPTRFRIFMAAPVRSELDFNNYIKGLYAELLVGLSEEEQQALFALLDLLSSPFAWEVLHTNWRLSPERITRTCLAAAQVLLDGLPRHPEWLEPSAPKPPYFQALGAQASKG
jgi:AcrR family transcriptional regulator